MTNIIRKICKVILVLLIIQIIFAIKNISQAASIWNDIFTGGNDFFQTGQNAVNSGNIVIEESEGGDKVTISTPKNSDIREIISDIYNIIFPLGVAITVIVGGVLGINFMMASAEDKAKVKESLVPYVIGCIAIYGAFGIWKIVITVFSAIG